MTSPASSLGGVRVVVTRAEQQAGDLVALLGEAGAVAELLPLLEIRPPADDEELRRHAAEAERYDWVVLTSANAVRAWLRLEPTPGPRVAAIGGATAAALAELGHPADHVGDGRRGEDLVASLASRLIPSQRVLLPQANDARTAVRDGLVELGVIVDTVVAYRKTIPRDARARARAIFGDEPLGWVTFTSPSTVKAFLQLHADLGLARLRTLLAASIGPTTSRALTRAGIVPAAEATRPGAAELVAAIAEAVRAA